MKVRHKMAIKEHGAISMTLGYWHEHYRQSKKYLNYVFWDVPPIYELHEIDYETGDTTFLRCDFKHAILHIVKRQPNDFVLIEYQGDKLDKYLMPIDSLDNIQFQENRSQSIVQKFNTDYVRKQIKLMNVSISDKPDTALGTAKELIETCCFEILKTNEITPNKNWKLLKLVKETNKHLEFLPESGNDNTVLNTAIKKILGGFANITHAISEIRNEFGTGHGKHPEFKDLETLYVRLAVSSASELVLFYKTLLDKN